MEVWIPIENYPWYQVSNLGRVRSIDKIIIQSNGVERFSKGRVLKPWLEFGYFRLDLSNELGKRSFSVHELVCTAFHGGCPKGMWCRHLDGVHTHNFSDNLMWGTPKQNSSDNLRNGVKVGLKPGSFVAPRPREVLKQAALKRWSNQDERKKQSERTKKHWNNKKVV